MDYEPKGPGQELEKNTRRASISLQAQEKAQELATQIVREIEQQHSDTLIGYVYSEVFSLSISDVDKWNKFEKKYNSSGGKNESFDMATKKALRIATLQKLGFMNENGSFFPDVDIDLHINRRGDEDSTKKAYYARSKTIKKAWLVRQIFPLVIIDGKKEAELLETIMYGSEDQVHRNLRLPLTSKAK